MTVANYVNSPRQQLITSMILSAARHLDQKPNPKASTDTGGLRMSFLVLIIRNTLWGPVTRSRVCDQAQTLEKALRLYSHQFARCAKESGHGYLWLVTNERRISLRNNRKNAAGWQSDLMYKKKTHPPKTMRKVICNRKQIYLGVLENP